MNSMENMHTDIRVYRVKSRKIRIHRADTLVMPNKEWINIILAVPKVKKTITKNKHNANNSNKKTTFYNCMVTVRLH